MSSSDDDDAPRGLGLGYGVKRGRRDKDEAALGVFGDGDEPHQRRGLGAKKKSSGPVMFVSAGKEEAKPQAPAPAPTMSNDDFRAQMAPPPTKTQKPKQPPTTATRPEWARHTKGVGFELMKKMGFTGRLCGLSPKIR